MDKYSEIRVLIAHDNPSIKRKESKCVLCGKCKDVCKKKIGVAGYWEYDSEDVVCINCGQCASVCPVDAITEQDDSQILLDALNNPKKKVVIMTSPAVRVSMGEMFNLPVGEIVQEKVVGALKSLGADFVFDVTFGADLTIMEEASELIDRIKNGKTMPMFTSCCPAWVKFVETFYPQFIPNLSSCKSPISMQASILKNYFAKAQGIDANDLFVVALTPCVAKKYEIKRPEFKNLYGQDTDLILSAREMSRLLKKQKINLKTAKPAQYDSAFPTGSGAGVIFGASGGVMEAAVRTAYYLITGENPPENLLNFTALRGYNGIKTAKVKLLGKDLNLCVISGTYNAREILPKLKVKKIDMLEVMACPNGCVGGGGQPKQYDNDSAVVKRANNLFELDKKSDVKSSYENSVIKKVYKEYLIAPLSDKAKEILHTTYSKKG